MNCPPEESNSPQRETRMKVIQTIGLSGIFLAANAGAQTTLKDAFKDDFLIGAALNQSVFSEQNQAEAALVKKQFNTISPENVLKWEAVHPQPDSFGFSTADRYVEFGEKSKMFIIGHNLIWHQQT